jgi:hypothetical protein
VCARIIVFHYQVVQKHRRRRLLSSPSPSTMPKYYCDYCDRFLTHDSFQGRKQHNRGKKHQDNIRMYFAQFMGTHGPGGIPYACMPPMPMRFPPGPPPAGFSMPPMPPQVCVYILFCYLFRLESELIRFNKSRLWNLLQLFVFVRIKSCIF